MIDYYRLSIAMTTRGQLIRNMITRDDQHRLCSRGWRGKHLTWMTRLPGIPPKVMVNSPAALGNSMGIPWEIPFRIPWEIYGVQVDLKLRRGWTPTGLRIWPTNTFAGNLCLRSPPKCLVMVMIGKPWFSSAPQRCKPHPLRTNEQVKPNIHIYI